jgi:hypothetical protein
LSKPFCCQSSCCRIEYTHWSPSGTQGEWWLKHNLAFTVDCILKLNFFAEEKYRLDQELISLTKLLSQHHFFVFCYRFIEDVTLWTATHIVQDVASGGISAWKQASTCFIFMLRLYMITLEMDTSGPAQGNSETQHSWSRLVLTGSLARCPVKGGMSLASSLCFLSTTQDSSLVLIELARFSWTTVNSNTVPTECYSFSNILARIVVDPSSCCWEPKCQIKHPLLLL